MARMKKAKSARRKVTPKGSGAPKNVDEYLPASRNPPARL